MKKVAWVLPMSRGEAATAIGLTGVAMAAASAAGAATNGRSKVFQASLMGFGLHAGTHLAQSAVLRRYTPRPDHDSAGGHPVQRVGVAATEDRGRPRSPRPTGGSLWRWRQLSRWPTRSPAFPAYADRHAITMSDR
ncbi:HXXEE domain-containing protein [Kribbella sp. C-35]|uniref:HXXEE domain-containing protein n=1 Tax=Kribbella sp. C-35 TaxID=2789276 RepID=UPI00397E6B70